MSSKMPVWYNYPTKGTGTRAVATGEVELKRSWSNSDSKERDPSWNTVVADMSAVTPTTTVEQAATNAEEAWKSRESRMDNSRNGYWRNRGGLTELRKTEDKSRAEGLSSLVRYLEGTSENISGLHLEVGCCVVTATTKGKPPFMYHTWRIKRSG